MNKKTAFLGIYAAAFVNFVIFYVFGDIKLSVCIVAIIASIIIANVIMFALDGFVGNDINDNKIFLICLIAIPVLVFLFLTNKDGE